MSAQIARSYNFQIAAASQAAQALQYGPNNPNNLFETNSLLSQPLMNGALMAATNPLIAAVTGNGNSGSVNNTLAASSMTTNTSNGLLTTAAGPPPTVPTAAMNSNNLAWMGLMNGPQSSTAAGLPNTLAAAQQFYAAWAAYALANNTVHNGNNASSQMNNGIESISNGKLANNSLSSSINTSATCDSSACNNSMAGSVFSASVHDSTKSVSSSFVTSSLSSLKNARSVCNNSSASKANDPSPIDCKPEINQINQLFNSHKKGKPV